MFEARKYSSITETEEIISAIKPDSKPIWAFKNIVVKLNIDELNNYLAKMKEAKPAVMHALIVYKTNITPVVNSNIPVLADAGFTIEIFQEITLAVNITKHELVSPHTKIDLVEARDLLNKVKKTQLPILLSSDPMCVFYGFCKGDIIKILRKDGTVNYRIVR